VIPCKPAPRESDRQSSQVVLLAACIVILLAAGWVAAAPDRQPKPPAVTASPTCRWSYQEGWRPVDFAALTRKFVANDDQPALRPDLIETRLRANHLSRYGRANLDAGDLVEDC
jgi:hypothetical protein